MRYYKQAPIITIQRIPKFSAIMLWPFIVIEKTKVGNSNLLEHEYTHWKQALKYGVIFWYLLYFMSKKLRLRFEVDAYKAQGCSKEYIAHQLTKYGLGLDYEEAYRLVRS